MNYPLVLDSGGLSAALRYGIRATMPTRLAYACSLVNVVGGFAAGRSLGLVTAGHALAAEWRLPLRIGSPGFSAFPPHLVERPLRANRRLALWHSRLNAFLRPLGALMRFSPKPHALSSLVKSFHA